LWRIEENDRPAYLSRSERARFQQRQLVEMRIQAPNDSFGLRKPWKYRHLRIPARNPTAFGTERAFFYFGESQAGLPAEGEAVGNPAPFY